MSSWSQARVSPCLCNQLNTKDTDIEKTLLSCDAAGEMRFRVAANYLQKLISFNKRNNHKYFIIIIKTFLPLTILSDRLRKLKRKERKIQQSCTSNCLRRISKVTKPLRAREIMPSADCTSSSMDAAKQKRKHNGRSG